MLLQGRLAELLPPLNGFEVTTDSSDRSPNFLVTKTGIQVGDRVLIEYRTDNDEYQIYINRTLEGGDISGAAVTLSGVTVLADNTLYDFRASWHRHTWGSTGTIVQHTIGTLSAAPIVANQEIFFGRLTRAGAGGVIPTHTGGDITSASIDSGTNANHWQISSIGVITPSSTGVSAGLSASYSLGCTFTNDAGSDGATITITTEANTYHVVADVAGTELKAAIANITDGPKTIKVRSGIGGSTSISVTGYGSGTGSRPTWTDYVTITSDDEGNPSTLHRLDFVGVNYIKLDNLIGGMPLDDGGGGSQSTACWQFRTTASWPDLDRIQVVNCHLESDPLDGANTKSGLGITDGTNITVQDNTFNGCYNCLGYVNCSDVLTKGNTITNFAGDGFRFSAQSASATPPSGVHRCSNHDILFNTGSAPIPSGGSAHPDFIQIGVSTNAVDYNNFNIIGNVLDDAGGGSAAQFIYIDDIAWNGDYRLNNAVIAGNVARCELNHGITVTDGDGVIIYNNTVVHHLPSTGVNTTGIIAFHDNSYPATSFNNNCDFRYNVATNFDGEALTGDTNMNFSDNHTVTKDNTSQYEAAFDDPDHANILTALAMKSGGPLDQAINYGAVGTGYVDFVAQTYSFPWE